jgi:hypothetical protein
MSAFMSSTERMAQPMPMICHRGSGNRRAAPARRRLAIAQKPGFQRRPVCACPPEPRPNQNFSACTIMPACFTTPCAHCDRPDHAQVAQRRRPSTAPEQAILAEDLMFQPHRHLAANPTRRPSWTNAARRSARMGISGKRPDIAPAAHPHDRPPSQRADAFGLTRGALGGSAARCRSGLGHGCSFYRAWRCATSANGGRNPPLVPVD